MAEYDAHFDIPYANATSPRQALDLYLPPHSTASSPLLVLIHGACAVPSPIYERGLSFLSILAGGAWRWGESFAPHKRNGHCASSPSCVALRDLSG
jgi:hypothetical protein